VGKEDLALQVHMDWATAPADSGQGSITITQNEGQPFVVPLQTCDYRASRGKMPKDLLRAMAMWRLRPRTLLLELGTLLRIGRNCLASGTRSAMTIFQLRQAVTCKARRAFNTAYISMILAASIWRLSSLRL